MQTDIQWSFNLEVQDMRKILKKILILSVVIVGFLFYFYPLQRIGAEIKFWQYIKVQGLPKEAIISKRAMKNYKQDGYYFFVKVQGDEKHEYEYKYFLIKKNKRRGLRVHEMYCDVFEDNRCLDDYSAVLYPPLE